MSSSQFPTSAIFMTASKKPIAINSTSMQRAEQLMTQALAKEEHEVDEFDDGIDDDELCRACDECDELFGMSQMPPSQQTQQQQTLRVGQEISNTQPNSNLTQDNSSGAKRKRLGVSTTPKERRAMIKK